MVEIKDFFFLLFIITCLYGYMNLGSGCNIGLKKKYLSFWQLISEK